MAGAEVFKTVFKGYQKEEVIAYIEQLNQQLGQLQNELDDTKTRLEQKDEEAREALEKMEQLHDAESTRREQLITELTPQLHDQLQKQLEEELRPQLERELRKKIEEELTPKYEEILRNEINNRNLHQTDELQELRRKAQLYDDNREVFAELMIKAKNDAGEIVREAEDQARALREEAEQHYRLLISDYELLKANLFATKGEAVGKLQSALKFLDDFEKRFSLTDQDVAYSEAHLGEI